MSPAEVTRCRATTVRPRRSPGVLARADDHRLGLVAGDLRLTPRRGGGQGGSPGRLASGEPAAGPFHVAVLLDNVPEFVFWLEAAALVGAVVVGANPTHRGDELVRDLTHTECQLLVTDSASLPLVEGIALGAALGVAGATNERVLVLDTPEAAGALAPYAGGRRGRGGSIPP